VEAPKTKDDIYGLLIKGSSLDRQIRHATDISNECAVLDTFDITRALVMQAEPLGFALVNARERFYKLYQTTGGWGVCTGTTVWCRCFSTFCPSDSVTRYRAPYVPADTPGTHVWVNTNSYNSQSRGNIENCIPVTSAPRKKKKKQRPISIEGKQMLASSRQNSPKPNGE
jgi:hypothetical protein